MIIVDQTPVTIPNPPLSQRDIALNMLEQLRVSLEADAVDDAVTHLAQLTDHLGEWQRSDTLKAARAWLDEALQGDLIRFDSEMARTYLQKWQDAASDEANPELADYRERVAQRSKQKNEALLIRGVMSLTDELLEQARTLEAGEDPPAPSFMMRQYYSKARDIVLSAQAEYDGNPELEQLVQRIKRLHNNKEVATTIFSLALESRKYSNALKNLAQLPDETLIPRFTATENAEGRIRLQYQTMIPLATAREELTTLAQQWATTTVNEAMATAQRYLDAHEPQAALDELELGDGIGRFLSSEQQTALEQSKSNATTQIRNQERATERATKAIELCDGDALVAWEELTAARGLYAKAEAVAEAQPIVLKAMRSRLKSLVREADIAFHEARDMVRVGEIGQLARAQFAEKDESLNDLLEQFNEFDQMVTSYQDYIKTGTEILEKVRGTIWEDAVAANEFLTQIESYPDFVLQAFDDLYDLRVQINQRLNADQTYNQLYTSLFNETLPEITQAIERTNVAGSDFPGDERFPQLEKWLKYHMAFITAVTQFERGAHEQVEQLIAPVLNHPQHPDYEDATKMRETIQAKPQSDDS